MTWPHPSWASGTGLLPGIGTWSWSLTSWSAPTPLPVTGNAFAYFNTLPSAMGSAAPVPNLLGPWGYFHCWWISNKINNSKEQVPGLTMNDLAYMESMSSMGLRVYSLDDWESWECMVSIHLQVRALWSSLWSQPHHLSVHQATCKHAICYWFLGRPHQLLARFHALLACLGVLVPPEYCFYPYRTTYNPETCLVSQPPPCCGLSAASTCLCPTCWWLMCRGTRDQTTSSWSAIPRGWSTIWWSIFGLVWYDLPLVE